MSVQPYQVNFATPLIVQRIIQPDNDRRNWLLKMLDPTAGQALARHQKKFDDKVQAFKASKNENLKLWNALKQNKDQIDLKFSNLRDLGIIEKYFKQYPLTYKSFHGRKAFEQNWYDGYKIFGPHNNYILQKDINQAKNKMLEFQGLLNQINKNLQSYSMSRRV